MQSVLSNSEYSFVASTKAITLDTALDEERILRITNLSTGAVIYDSTRRAYPISVAGAVITHTYDSSGMTDSDDLQIIVDTGATGL